MKTMNKSFQIGQKKCKKAYAAPKLTRYGKVTELTAGATGTASENSMGGSRRA